MRAPAIPGSRPGAPAAGSRLSGRRLPSLPAVRWPATRSPRLPGLLALLAALAAASCEPGETADPGLDLLLQVEGAQLVREAYPAAGNGPAVTAVELAATRIFPGESGRSLGGRAERESFVIRVGLAGDGGYWRLPVGLLDPSVSGELDFLARLAFAARLPPGPFRILLQALDGEGEGGPITEVPLLAVADGPTGVLAVTLAWDRQADVDLYVVDPAGIVLGPKNQNTYEPPAPGEPPDPPEAWESGGLLDFDSNAGCVLDGRRRESASWSTAPPAGVYEVRVALADPCGQERTSFTVAVRHEGEELVSAGGALFPADARAAPGEGEAAGLLVARFELP